MPANLPHATPLAAGEKLLNQWIAQERRRLARQAEATARVPYKELQRQHLSQHLKRLAGKQDMLFGQELARRFAADNPLAVLGAATGDVLEASSISVQERPLAELLAGMCADGPVTVSDVEQRYTD